ncbi:hypothetical protein F511_40204 [Dorcoceras hygrometricum]|uniref:Uncharacterized protein n=1 Tax=Dorcoceras hygrometricum TaxID=472368 RepID=A0A2Z7ANB0_9LAMI|nr:hypothetical protein F511_40204 [Dorcoceras hygrometricum]
MGNSSAYVSATVGSRSIEKTILLTSASSHMFRGNSDACVSATVESLTIKKTVLLTSFHSIVFNGNRSAYSWTATDSQIFDLLSDAHSKSLEDLLAQQREHGLPLAQPCPSPIVDSSVDSGAVLARFYSIANSTCWMPAPAIQDTFVPHVSFIEPVQYWEEAPYLIKTWRWVQVCTDIVRFSLFGFLKPVRVLPCTDITVYNLGVERIPADFLRMFAQGMACHNFVDSVVQRDSGDIQEVVLTDVEEVYLVSSDVSTVYRSPSPLSPEVDSFENDLRFALGPAIFSSVEQKERLYFVQSPESPPAISPHQESSSSSTDVSMQFDSTDIPVNAQADTQTSAPVDFTMFTDSLQDLRSSIFQRIHDSNCEILSKVNAVELGVRGDLLKLQVLLRQSLENACRIPHTLRQTSLQTESSFRPLLIQFRHSNALITHIENDVAQTYQNDVAELPQLKQISPSSDI